MERDEGNILVLEAMIISLILLGAAYGVQTMQSTRPTEHERPRQQLTKVATDALIVMDGLDDGNGTLLDMYLAEAYHCAVAPSPVVTDCDAHRPRNFSFRMESYLPTGAGFQLSLGNGVTDRVLYTSPLPRGEAVAASLSYTPTWNFTFVTPELSCYEPGMDVNLTLIPVLRARTSNATWANVTVGATETAGVAAHTANWYNVTLPALTRPASGEVRANVTGRAYFDGATSYGACALGGLGSTVVAALREATFGPAQATAPLGTDVAFSADLAGLDAIPGVSIASADVSLYDPIPARSPANSYTRTASIETTGSTTRSAAWRVPSDALYGTHVAVLEVALDVGGLDVVAYKVALVDVALPSGHVPIDPPYRAVLQAWFPEWG